MPTKAQLAVSVVGGRGGASVARKGVPGSEGAHAAAEYLRSTSGQLRGLRSE